MSIHPPAMSQQDFETAADTMKNKVILGPTFSLRRRTNISVSSGAEDSDQWGAEGGLCSVQAGNLWWCQHRQAWNSRYQVLAQSEKVFNYFHFYQSSEVAQSGRPGVPRKEWIQRLRRRSTLVWWRRWKRNTAWFRELSFSLVVSFRPTFYFPNFRGRISLTLTSLQIENKEKRLIKFEYYLSIDKSIIW